MKQILEDASKIRRLLEDDSLNIVSGGIAEQTVDAKSKKPSLADVNLRSFDKDRNDHVPGVTCFANFSRSAWAASI